jgi:hypothetical protein
MITGLLTRLYPQAVHIRRVPRFFVVDLSDLHLMQRFPHPAGGAK